MASKSSTASAYIHFSFCLQLNCLPKKTCQTNKTVSQKKILQEIDRPWKVVQAALVIYWFGIRGIDYCLLFDIKKLLFADFFRGYLRF